MPCICPPPAGLEKLGVILQVRRRRVNAAHEAGASRTEAIVDAIISVE